MERYVGQGSGFFVHSGRVGMARRMAAAVPPTHKAALSGKTQRWGTRYELQGLQCLKQLAGLCAISSPKATSPVVPAAISGRLIKWPLTLTRTAPLARKPDKLRTSNAGITPCANAWLALCAKHCPFPSPTTFTNSKKLLRPPFSASAFRWQA